MSLGLWQKGHCDLAFDKRAILEWSLTEGPFHAKQREIEASLVFDKRAIVAGSLTKGPFSVQDPFNFLAYRGSCEQNDSNSLHFLRPYVGKSLSFAVVPGVDFDLRFTCFFY